MSLGEISHWLAMGGVREQRVAGRFRCRFSCNPGKASEACPSWQRNGCGLEGV